MDIVSNPKLLYDDSNDRLEDLSNPIFDHLETTRVVDAANQSNNRGYKALAENATFFSKNKGGCPFGMEEERQEVIMNGQQKTYYKRIRFCLY
ncbi:hypothetical protein MKX54_00495 [Alkalihalobacillus sp. FSL R5-0424]